MAYFLSLRALYPRYAAWMVVTAVRTRGLCKTSALVYAVLSPVTGWDSKFWSINASLGLSTPPSGPHGAVSSASLAVTGVDPSCKASGARSRGNSDGNATVRLFGVGLSKASGVPKLGISTVESPPAEAAWVPWISDAEAGAAPGLP